MNVEHGTFTSLAFSLAGGKGPEVSMFHKHIAQTIPAKTKENYDRVLSLITCKVPFLISRSVFFFLENCSVSGNHVHFDGVSLIGQAGLF